MVSLHQAWRNPLARPADRAEATLRMVLVALWLSALPIVAVVGAQVRQDVSSIAASQQHSRLTTTAQLLADAPDLTYDDQGLQLAGQVEVSARWVAPDGSERIGEVPAAPGGRSGDRLSIWVDRAGDVTEPPVDPATIVVLIITVTTLIAMAWGGLLAAAHLIVRRRLDRRRFAGWDAQWQRIEPLWSGRSGGGNAQP